MIRRLLSPRLSKAAVATTFLSFLLLPQAARAQAVYGSVRGAITDASGGLLPGVSVTITSRDRNTSDTVVTGSDGVYRKERLLPGVYEVKADLQGFKQAVVSDVVVSVDSQANVDFSLQPGNVTESVEVVATSPLLKTDRADVSTTFEAKQITDLPVLDRNFTKFILLTPGAQQQQWGHAASENPQGSTQTVVNGQSFSGTSYQLDGTDNRDPILGIIVINPTLESIGETKITSQNYDAEFGQAVAGVVSVQTKSGANTFRGSAFEFYQSDKFQARNPFTQAQPEHAHRQVPAGHQEEPVRRIARRPDRGEPPVLLRRLPGAPQHGRRIAAAERADGSGPPRRSQRLRRQHLRPADRRAGRARRSSRTTSSPPTASRRRRSPFSR